GIAILVRNGMVRPIWMIGVSPALFVFVTLVINVIRFSHGNIRLLDDSYMYDTENGKRGGICNCVRKNRIFVAYSFVLFLSVLFSVSAFYLLSPSDFAVIFLGVLGVDVVWAAFSYSENAPKNHRAVQRGWFINNIVCGVGLFGAVLTGALSRPYCPDCSQRC